MKIAEKFLILGPLLSVLLQYTTETSLTASNTLLTKKRNYVSSKH